MKKRWRNILRNGLYNDNIYNINEIQLYQAYRNKAGKIIKKMEVSKDFDSQPYDYPIGNIYYIKIWNLYLGKVFVLGVYYE